MNKRGIITVVALLLIAGGGIWWWLSARSSPVDTTAAVAAAPTVRDLGNGLYLFERRLSPIAEQGDSNDLMGAVTGWATNHTDVEILNVVPLDRHDTKNNQSVTTSVLVHTRKKLTQ